MSELGFIGYKDYRIETQDAKILQSLNPTNHNSDVYKLFGSAAI